MVKTKTDKAILGEKIIYKKLLENGINAEWVSKNNRNNYTDIITLDGIAIDVKYATKTTYNHNNVDKKTRYIWKFNMQHNGVKQKGIDYYICVAKDNSNNHIFIFPAKHIKGYGITISELQLKKGKYKYYENNWGLIKTSTTMKINNYKFNGKDIKNKMIAYGIKQLDMSRELGITHATLSRWLNGHIYPPVNMICKINEILHSFNKEER